MKRPAPPPPGPAPGGEVPLATRRLSGTGPRVSRPTVKPPPPPKPASVHQTSADVHPRPHSPSSPYYNVPPPYSTHPLRPSRPAPGPPAFEDKDQSAKQEPDMIAPVVAPSVGAAVRRPPSFVASPDERHPGKQQKHPEEVEMNFLDGRNDPKVTQAAPLLHNKPAKKLYDPEELPPPDYFVLSLVTCLCCCLPIGCIALIFSVCSSNASGVGKTKRGRRLGNIALVLSIVGCVAAISTALALYFTGTGEVIFNKIKNLIVNGTQPAIKEVEQGSSRESDYYGSIYDYGQRGNKAPRRNYDYY